MYQILELFNKVLKMSIQSNLYHPHTFTETFSIHHSFIIYKADRICILKH